MAEKKIISKIVLIGTGNLATQLGIALQSNGFETLQVYSRTKRSAALLAKKLNTASVTSLNEITKNADAYILAIKDDAIEEVTKQLHLKDKLLMHTSGSADMQALKHSSINYGVLYPLQTFSINKPVNFKEVPFCIEGNNKESNKAIEEIAKALSKNIYKIDSEQRRALHLAAVFACNFSNHMYAVAENILKENKLPFDLLLPLIEETANKVKVTSPKKAQTGPAIRNDEKIMKSHLSMLKKKKDLLELYKLISSGILNNTR